MNRILASIAKYHFSNQGATRCMILHPVSFPNKGPIIEQYLAQQAVGLAKSLGWSIVKGPFWDKDSKIIVPLRVRNKHNTLYVENNPDEVRDGDYIRTSIGNGILQGDGILFDEQESQSQGDLYKQWRDKLLRESLANSSLMKVKKTTKKTFFTKGKLFFIADYLSKHETDCLYINSQLKPTQIKNLKKFMQAHINGISASHAFKGFNDSETQTQFETEDKSQLKMKRQSKQFKTIKIFDRFSIILQIFAQRSTTRLSKLQIQLSYLRYLKTRLVRQGAVYSSNLNLFYGDLMKAEEVVMEVISAKQRKATGIMSGQGQSQLQIERRNLRDRQAKIRRQIQEESRLRKINQQKVKKRNSSIPTIALVGYTNVGKSAFMNNLMKKQQVKSKDLLFQTLHTTSRHITLPSGSKIILLDTIGFITNLPVEMVEAFKSTLEEISHADLVIHLRDISHPHHQLQKQSVIKILKDLKFHQSFYQSRMIQVWNKIDLQHQIEVKDDSSMKISCITGAGMIELVKLIQDKLHLIEGKRRYEVEYSIQFHQQVLNWLKENTNHSFHVETQYNYTASNQFPSGSIKLHLDLSQASINKLNKFLNPDKPKTKQNRGMPPKEGW